MSDSNKTPELKALVKFSADKETNVKFAQSTKDLFESIVSIGKQKMKDISDTWSKTVKRMNVTGKQYFSELQKSLDKVKQLNMKATQSMADEWKKGFDKTKEGWKKQEALAKKATQSMADSFRKNWTDRIKANEKVEEKAHRSRASRVAETIGYYASLGTAIYGTVNAIKNTIVEYLKLDKVMNQIKAITSSTVENLNKLTTEVRVVSSEISKSIEDVSKYAVSMSKLGLSVGEIITITKSVSQLSAVLGEDLNKTGILVVTTLKQFNLEVEEANYVSSVFFNAIKKSPLDIDGLSTAMQYVGSSAEAVGVNFKEAGDMMVLLSERGLKAAKIGTGLRNVFIKLKDDGGDVVETLRELNESGLQFSEAVDLFGRRGAIAGYNLVANFGELETMFKEKLPTAMDNFRAEIQATSGTLDYLSRTWGRTKSFFTDWNALAEQTDDKYVRNIIGYVNELKNVEQVFSELNEYAKDGNKSGFVKIIEESLPKGIDYSGSLKRATKKLYDELFNVYKLQSLISEGRETAKDDLGFIGLMTPKSIDMQNKLITDAQSKILEYREKLNKLKEGDPSVILTGVTEYELKGSIKFLEKRLLELQQINSTSKEEALQILTDNGELARNIIRSTAKDMGWSAERLNKELDNMKTTYDKWFKIVCLNYPELSLCKKDKGKYKRTSDKDSSIDIEMGDAYDKVVVDFKEMFAQDTINYNGTLKGITDYYDLLSKLINNEENRALEKIKKNREGIKGEYLLKKEDLAKEMNGATGKTLAGYKEKDIKLDEDYRKQRESLDRQEINVVKTTNLAKIKLKKKYEKDIDSLNKATQKKNDELNKQMNAKKKKRYKQELEDEATFREQMFKIASSSVAALQNIYNKFSREALNNKLESVSAELEAVKNRYSVENDILKSQFDNNVISAEAYEKKREELEKNRIDKENKLNKAAFEAQKRNDINEALANGAANTAEAILSTLAQAKGGAISKAAQAAIIGGIAAVQAAAEVSAISNRKFYPVKYADGGEVVGKSHSNGGVPFTVNGEGGYEMEGGEFIVNKYAAKKNKSLLEALNSKPIQYSDSKFFSDGGKVPTQTSRSEKSTQVVRAYITKRDLRDYEIGERNIKNISRL